MLRGLSMLQIDHWLLSRHVPGGRKFPELDCWGLVCDVYRSLGAELPEFADLSQSTMGQGYDQCLAAHVFYPVTVPEDFDLVAFFHRDRFYHVGIWYQEKMLHTTERKNCRLERVSHFMLYASNYNVRFYRCALLSAPGKISPSR